jgi:hypothetical protein
MTLASSGASYSLEQTTSGKGGNWGTGYFAEGARGSSGQHPNAGDRSRVESLLNQSFERKQPRTKKPR